MKQALSGSQSVLGGLCLVGSVQAWYKRDIVGIPNVILLIDRETDYGRGLLQGITQYATVHGPWMPYTGPVFYRESRQSIVQWMQDLGADGIIARAADPKLVNAISLLGIPAIISGTWERVSNMHVIISDHASIGHMAAEYFLDRGFRRFAFCGFQDTYWSQERYEAFSSSVAQAGFAVDSYRHPESAHRHIGQDECPDLSAWLASLPKPIGLMTCNDDRSQHIAMACKMSGIQIPDEVAVLGVDNDELVCNLSYPRLSSIALDTKKAGYEAAVLLDRLMTGQSSNHGSQQLVIHPLYVVTRQSTDILAVEDPEVAAAIRFIREHHAATLQINDIAEAAGLSCRTLQYRFRRLLGCSVRDQIKRTRIDQATHLLMDTNLSIAEIARTLGYPYVRSMTRWFKQEVGMSPLAYRSKRRAGQGR